MGLGLAARRGGAGAAVSSSESESSNSLRFRASSTRALWDGTCASQVMPRCVRGRQGGHTDGFKKSSLGELGGSVGGAPDSRYRLRS